jgi:tRNA (guanine26-N2/guanine27-N2)-dimethyltransferase
MLQKITEGKAVIKAGKGKVSKKLDVFYNPVMKFNRDISILILNAVDNKNMQIGLPLEASGVRGIRFFKELKKGKIKKIYFNDYSESAVKAMKENLKLNHIKSKFELTKKDANIFMLESSGFDYIDIDPFGSPNQFLDSAVKRLARGGILAVTATDTSLLCGTYSESCGRKYWAKPMHTSEMYEAGLRILIRKVQLIASQYDKSLIPIFSYSKDHYMRVFFRCEKSKKDADDTISKHGFYKSSGPMWLGPLSDKKIAEKVCRENKSGENRKFLETVRDEPDIVGYYDLHEFCSKNKLEIPRKDELMKALRKHRYAAAQTHFLSTAIKSDIKENDLIRIIRQLFSHQ